MLHNRTWLLMARKLANEASADELRELETILRANPELHFTLQALSDLWQQHHPSNAAELEQAYEAHLDRMNAAGLSMPVQTTPVPDPDPFGQPAQPSRLRKTFRALATGIGIAAIVLLCIAPFVFHNKPSTTVAARKLTPTSEISTRNGSKTNIVLTDGTKVWLNAGSKISYDKAFGETERRITLTGEAYFDVTHDPNKPFIIHTQAMDIRVLGTVFNVKSYPEDHLTETSLIRGSIEVTLNDNRAQKIMMKPNEKLVIKDELPDTPTRQSPRLKNRQAEEPIISLIHLNYFSKDSTILETSWVYNRLVFEDESFAQLAKRMERWYGVRFVFGNEDIAQQRFTGSFQNETVVQALEAMQITAKFNYRIEDKTITITD